MSRTLSGMFVGGPFKRPRRRKRTNRENPHKTPEGPKRTEKGEGPHFIRDTTCLLTVGWNFPAYSRALYLQLTILASLLTIGAFFFHLQF